MNSNNSLPDDNTKRMLVDIESTDRLTSDSIDKFSRKPALLKSYLDASTGHTFSELMFRLTHEIYTEKKASNLWHKIVKHRKDLKNKLNRDMGMLVSALDYLSNISGDISSPKIMGDLRIEAAAAMATRDALTGLYLHGVLDFMLEQMVAEHSRYNKSLSLLMLDIDDFKQVNDVYGHQFGDEILQKLGRITKKTIRDADFPVRYGGEEFVIVFPDTAIDSAAEMAERLRMEVSRYCSENGPKITVSIGVSCIRDPDVITASELIRQADDVMYKVKSSGKNCVGKMLGSSG
ncbi:MULTISPECIES: GGDEF domain-containing protein [unclassified Colwellia]|uniref:GGDEF domain-containing protein n=1 Tax=unclassified Colwellia TaxID=196834 RepID=UPI0015F4D8A0|nr:MULTISPECIES: GGDEF domain-containing protein [unclassified Colwellia]MBA6233630.1 GGDEF domain-containing protein [Colwellia sp. MB02u-7]MBA6238190.1 GGDEF domain-containing protein [Colwellia sp. MB02u-11]MBA6255046.1 GGDEF domain-containing protein [Colwellia sp. MB3u-28]MBA6259003.1 GGDEF domain-containing protein [Colwellia sp. MB3u-41]MBA6299673.1 GGDEF domain-containing protein [Colwellia sp. MB3u-22]